MRSVNICKVPSAGPGPEQMLTQATTALGEGGTLAILLQGEVPGERTRQAGQWGHRQPADSPLWDVECWGHHHGAWSRAAGEHPSRWAVCPESAPPTLGWQGREEETCSPRPFLLPDLLGRSLISTMKGHERSSQATSSDDKPPGDASCPTKQLFLFYKNTARQLKNLPGPSMLS